MVDHSNIKLPINCQEIARVIPHRFPFLLVDRVTMISQDEIEGYKNITINEPFFSGHFPEHPIMPGVLIVEALAQISCFHRLFLDLEDLGKDKLGVFTGIDNCKFKAPVYPGDRLDLKAALTWKRGPLGKCHAEAKVGDRLVTTTDLMFAMVEKEELK